MDRLTQNIEKPPLNTECQVVNIKTRMTTFIKTKFNQSDEY